MRHRLTAVEIRKHIRFVNRRLAKGGEIPRNSDRSLWGEFALMSFASVTGLTADSQADPDTVLVDLLTDLMHWCSARPTTSQSIDFEWALERARAHYTEESPANF